MSSCEPEPNYTAQRLGAEIEIFGLFVGKPEFSAAPPTNRRATTKPLLPGSFTRNTSIAANATTGPILLATEPDILTSQCHGSDARSLMHES